MNHDDSHFRIHDVEQGVIYVPFIIQTEGTSDQACSPASVMPNSYKANDRPNNRNKSFKEEKDSQFRFRSDWYFYE